jgi:Putative lumazine-binding
MTGGMGQAARAILALAFAALCVVPTLHAQSIDVDQRAVIAVADSVLVALSSGDQATLKRLTLDSAIVGGAGLRNGVERMSMGSWARFTSRGGPSDFIERGFSATARVQDRVAQVWVPYDLYIGKTWSHCGVDAFTLIKSEGRWRIASLIYTIEQPPACQKHPSGPPGQ